MVEHPSKVTNTNEAGDRHLAIVDSVSIAEVSPIESKGESAAELGRFEIRDEGTLIWSIAYGPQARTRKEARRMADRIAGAYSLGKTIPGTTESLTEFRRSRMTDRADRNGGVVRTIASSKRRHPTPPRETPTPSRRNVSGGRRRGPVRPAPS